MANIWRRPRRVTSACSRLESCLEHCKVCGGKDVISSVKFSIFDDADSTGRRSMTPELLRVNLEVFYSNRRREGNTISRLN